MASAQLAVPFVEEMASPILSLPKVGRITPSNGNANKLSGEDRPVHNWYRFVLSFPPHLVRSYLEPWGITDHHRVYDPFCGTGTTLVECKKLGIPSLGTETNPMAHFAATTKTDWTTDPKRLLHDAERLAEAAEKKISDTARPLRTLSEVSQALLLGSSISPLPLHKLLVLHDTIDSGVENAAHLRLALAKTAVVTASNLKFGPEVGVGPIKHDAPVVSAWLDAVRGMASDLDTLRSGSRTAARVLRVDARDAARHLEPESIDAVFTSPPYPNEKDYLRTTRLETVLLGFASDKDELRAIKKTMLRSNTRGVYKEDVDDQWVQAYPSVLRLADAIEARRIELGKTSGFERLYARVTKLYFGGMARHLADIRPLLRPGARLGYVVGDQASYLRVMIRTGDVLAEIAQSLGYRLVKIDLFRTRLATATGEMMREEVVVLEWPGNTGT